MSALQLEVDPSKALSATQKVRQGLDAVTASAVKAEAALEDAGNATTRMENGRRVIQRTGKGMEEAFAGVGSAADRMGRTANDNLQGIQRQMIASAGAGSRLSGAFDQVKASVVGLGTAAAAAMRSVLPLVAAIGGAAAVSGVVRTSAEFESLGASLKTVTGSAANAERAFAYLRQFATDTPYGLQQVTEAFIRLQALGLDPSRKALESYGNTASAMGKPIMQFVEAVADAVTGENERLKEFGIRASVDGEKVAYTFQGVTTVVGNNAREIEGYLRRLGEVQFGGAMAEQMTTLSGTFANFQDAAEGFSNAIGEGGLSAAIKTSTADVTEFLSANEDLARSLGAFLGGELEAARNDFGQLSSELTSAWRWMKATAEVVGTMTSAFAGGGQQIIGIAGGMTAGAEAFASAWNGAGRAIYAILNGIIGVGVGAYQSIVATWDQLPAAFGALGKGAANILLTALEGGVNGALSGVNRIIEAINSVAPEFAQIPAVPPLDLSQFKQSLTEVQGASAQTVQSIMSAATSTDYLGAGMDALAAPIAAAGAEIAAAKGRLDEAAAATQNLGDAARLTGEGFQIVPPGTGEAIENGVTKPSKEATKALRDAEQAKRALLSEADAAVSEFFPVQAAEAEATRLRAAIGDTTNGLSDLQRQALGLKIDQGFRDAYEQASGFGRTARTVNDTLRETGSLAEDMGDIFADVFSSATRDGEGFFESVIPAFAGIGDMPELFDERSAG